MKFITMPSPRIPVAGQAQVIVAGGGPAGVCAAIAAARNGAKTVLLEKSGCLGGTASRSRLFSPIIAPTG